MRNSPNLKRFTATLSRPNPPLYYLQLQSNLSEQHTAVYWVVLVILQSGSFEHALIRSYSAYW